MAESKKISPKKTVPKKTVSKKAPAKKGVAKKTTTSKKSSPKAVKSVEQEIEEAAVRALKATKTVAKSAVSKAKEVIADAHLDEKLHSAEKVGKKAIASAKKKVEEVHIEETSKQYISRVSGTLKKLGAKISYKARGLEEVPTAAGKSISSALIAGKASARRSMAAMGITRKEPPKHKIFGLEVSDEMFRGIVLTFLLVLFFYIGMLFGQMQAYHHIEKKLYKMGTYEKQMKYDRDDMMMQDRIDFPNQEIQVFPGTDIPQDDVMIVEPIMPEFSEIIEPIPVETVQ